MNTMFWLSRSMKLVAMAGLFLAAFGSSLAGADSPKQEQEPPVIDPGPVGGPPSDAIVLFDGKDLSKFHGERSVEPLWRLENGVMETTPHGGLLSKEEFGDCQVHVEWASPSVVKGNGQGRGNSGVYLMGRYEIQVLDCYNNKTYPTASAARSMGTMLRWSMCAASRASGKLTTLSSTRRRNSQTARSSPVRSPCCKTAY